MTSSETPVHDCCSADDDAHTLMAQRLLTWVTIGGLALGTYGTFHAVTSLVFGVSPADRPFTSVTFAAIHRIAVVTVLASQVLQLVGSTALFRRRLLGRTLLLTYAFSYLTGLVLVQTMRALDAATSFGPAPTSQRVLFALGEMNLLIYGSVFPMFLIAVLSRPWVVRLLRRKGETLDPAPDTTAELPAEHRRAA